MTRGIVQIYLHSTTANICPMAFYKAFEDSVLNDSLLVGQYNVDDTLHTFQGLGFMPHNTKFYYNSHTSH